MLNKLRKLLTPASTLHPDEVHGVVEYQKRLARKLEPNYLLGSAGPATPAVLVLDAMLDGKVTMVNVELGQETIHPRKLHVS